MLVTKLVLGGFLGLYILGMFLKLYFISRGEYPRQTETYPVEDALSMLFSIGMIVAIAFALHEVCKC